KRRPRMTKNGLDRGSQPKEDAEKVGPIKEEQESSRFSVDNSQEKETLEALHNTIGLKDDANPLNRFKVINRRLATLGQQMEDVGILQSKILESTDRLLLMQ